MEDLDQVSDVDKPLARLRNEIEAGAEIEIVDLKGANQVNVQFGDGVTVSPEEHDMKAALAEYRDVLLEMVDVGEEEWPDVLDEYGVGDDRRREQLRVFAVSAQK